MMSKLVAYGPCAVLLALPLAGVAVEERTPQAVPFQQTTNYIIVKQLGTTHVRVPNDGQAYQL
ncbi:hypothetical protein [Pseudomonas sp. DC3200b2]|uniref:hypothetical protein n=1 Tax=Pseudomonas sp. DC3200b2 TaxID=2804669 RepID=UPI003CFB06CB